MHDETHKPSGETTWDEESFELDFAMTDLSHAAPKIVVRKPCPYCGEIVKNCGCARKVVK